MRDPLSVLKPLQRPRLLVRAAHLGLDDYRRDQSLGRLLPEGASDGVQDTFSALREREAQVDEERRSGGATYSPARHIELLAALILEARLLSRKLA